MDSWIFFLVFGSVKTPEFKVSKGIAKVVIVFKIDAGGKMFIGGEFAAVFEAIESEFIIIISSGANILTFRGNRKFGIVVVGNIKFYNVNIFSFIIFISLFKGNLSVFGCVLVCIGI